MRALAGCAPPTRWRAAPADVTVVDRGNYHLFQPLLYQMATAGVLATGTQHAYFGYDEWESVAPDLKKIDDATAIFRRILTAFESAEAAQDHGACRAT